MNDRRIHEAVESGARTVAQVGRACGAGTGCGGCARAVADILESAEIVQKAAFIGSALPIAAE